MNLKKCNKFNNLILVESMHKIESIINETNNAFIAKLKERQLYLLNFIKSDYAIKKSKIESQINILYQSKIFIQTKIIETGSLIKKYHKLRPQ